MLTERVELSRDYSWHREAVEEGRSLVELWRAEASECAVELAVAESLLARAYLEVGDLTQASTVAGRAMAVLLARQHPEWARCRMTLALAGEDPISKAADDSLRMVEATPFLSADEKRRSAAGLAGRASQTAA